MKKGRQFDINEFRQLLMSNTIWFQLVRITSELDDQEIAMDGSSYQVEAVTIPDLNPILLHVTQNAGLECSPRKDQIWLCAFDYYRGGRQAFLIQKLVDMQSLLHPKAREKHTVVKSESDKHIYCTNKLDAEFEPSVLGDQLKTWLISLVDEVRSVAGDVESLKNTFNTHLHVSSGSPPSIPSGVTTTSEQTALNRLKSDAEIDKIQSDMTFIQSKEDSE